MSDLASGVQAIYEGSRIYVDPFYDPDKTVGLLDVLPLILDRIIVYDPSADNLRSWGYPFDRFSKLVNHGIFVPLFVEPNEDFNSEKSIVREDILPGDKFFAEYDDATSYDIGDNGFSSICERLDFDCAETSFSLNWDIIVSQLLQTPVYTTHDMLSLWTYKFARAWHDIGILAKKPEMVDQPEIIERFLSYTVSRLPEDLSVEEIVEFRKHGAAVNFRTWLASTIAQASSMRQMTQAEIDLHLVQRFNEMAEKYAKEERRATKVAETSLSVGLLAAMVASAAPAVSSLATPVVGLATHLALPKILKEIWKSRTPNNWIFMLLELGTH